MYLCFVFVWLLLFFWGSSFDLIIEISSSSVIVRTTSIHARKRIEKVGKEEGVL